MSSVDVLPSAPPEAPLYPVLPEPSGNFRLLKINEIAQTLDNEVGHYRLVAKKYKRAKKFVNWSAAGSSVVSAVFSSASFGSAMSVVGLPAAVPLGGVGGCFALISSALIIASRKLETKIKKHHEITTLAVSKRDTVNRLLSKALANNNVSSHEFDTILSEFERYNFLKEQVRAKILRQPSKRKISEVDVKKMEKDIRGKVEAEMLKKIADAASSNSR
jgi:hypothetical protein